MIYLIVFRTASAFMLEEHISSRELGYTIKDTFKTPVPSMRTDIASATSVMAYASRSAMHADFPNGMFASAIDLSTIKKNIMTMDRQRLDSEELEDQEAFMALSKDIISDLLDEEPDIYTSDDAKVRFR
jgi:hypothetical protein